MVELTGVEPVSENISEITSTCLVGLLKFHFIELNPQILYKTKAKSCYLICQIK